MNANESIHPRTIYDDVSEEPIAYTNGLTKREYFAGLAMSGLLANPNPGSIETNAKLAIMSADALITELNKQP